MAITLRYCAVVVQTLQNQDVLRVQKKLQNFTIERGFHALSMQDVCDAKRRIRSATIMCPGSVHDSLAYACSTLAFLIREGNLPQSLFLNGDHAYACDEQDGYPVSGQGAQCGKEFV